MLFKWLKMQIRAPSTVDAWPAFARSCSHQQWPVESHPPQLVQLSGRGASSHSCVPKLYQWTSAEWRAAARHFSHSSNQYKCSSSKPGSSLQWAMGYDAE